MISADTIAALEAEKIEYILGVRERTSRTCRGAPEDQASFTTGGRNELAGS